MRKTLLLIMLITVGLSLCYGQHFIADKTIRNQVTTDYAAKAKLWKGAAVLPTSLSSDVREAAEFLYAYMPLSDMADYPTAFYINNIRTSLKARKEMAWGKTIPEEIFRHFVLPIRVNNENMDSSRMVFYPILKERVKGMSMKDAILEVNHWCHEHVVYQPSDSRTSAPLATLKTAYGRCGEESTFTVAALRSIGIPARQVYTPRWAHTDDNHAWVEAWADGKWWFMGACEPEAVLNLGWFNAPARRSMLMHTNVFGKYHGPEEVIGNTACTTEINVTSNYAPVSTTVVNVFDKDGKPAANAKVEFKLYNYGEYYSVATKKADVNGKASLTAGLGDLLVWASKDGYFGYKHISVGKDKNVTVALTMAPGNTMTEDFNMIPPVEGNIDTPVTDMQKADNAARLAKEDEIRNAYVATFITKEQSAELAKKLNMDSEKVENFMAASRGNWKDIESVLDDAAKNHAETNAIALLGVISQKDLRDAPKDILLTHLYNTTRLEMSEDLWNQYVLNPRVSNERLTSYKKELASIFSSSAAEQYRSHPELLAGWVKQHIAMKDDLNPQRIPISPIGVWKAKAADHHSRDIFYIAVARSLGIAARINPVDDKVQFSDGTSWKTVDFETAKQNVAPQGKVVADYEASKVLQDPGYYTHFTIAKVHNDGTLQTLNFELEDNNEVGYTWKTLLSKPLSLDEGNYLLITGTRLANGSVLSHVTSFSVKENETTPVKLIMRIEENAIQVIGSFNSEDKYMTTEGKETSLLKTTGRGYYIVAVIGSRQEPTNHAMRDIASVSQELEKWGRPMVILFPDKSGFENFDVNEFKTLPKTISYGIDANHSIQKELVMNLKLTSASQLPIFVIADTFNRVVFVMQGYTIGMGQQLMKTINNL